MSNEIIKAAQYLPSLYTEADVKALADEFGGGLSQGVMFPRIGLKGTRFAIKDGDLEQVIPQSTIDIVIVRARPTIDKTWYASKYDPNSEEKAGPDCYSKDGIKPAADAMIPQCEICATCHQNAFGSGTDQNGNPSKGKACSDTKQLAVFAQGKCYGFKITPASLKAYNAYLKTLAGYSLTPPVVVTRIGFDPNFTYPVLTFEYVATLDPAQAGAIQQMRTSQEVEDICGAGNIVAAPPTPAVAHVAPAPVVVEPVVEPAPVFGVGELGGVGGLGGTPAPAPAKPAATRKKTTAAQPTANPAPVDTGATAAPAPATGNISPDILASLGL